MNRDSWLAWRRSGVGASDVASIVGVDDAYSTPYAVWLSKVDAEFNTGDSEPMAWGRLLEDIILDEVERRTGLHARWRQLCAAHPDAPHHLATLDAIAIPAASHGVRAHPGRLRSVPVHAPDDVDPAALAAMAPRVLADLADAYGVDEAIEVKNTSQRRYRFAEVPDRFYVQAQWQCWVGNLSAVHVTVLHTGTNLEVYTVERSDDDIDWLVSEVDRFWTEHVLTRTPPPFCGDDLSLIRDRAGRGDGSVLTADAQLAALVVQTVGARQAAKVAKDYADGLTATLLAAAGPANLIVDAGGQELARLKVPRSFDATAAAEAFPELAAEVTKLDASELRKRLGRKAEPFMLDDNEARRVTFPTTKRKAVQ